MRCITILHIDIALTTDVMVLSPDVRAYFAKINFGSAGCLQVQPGNFSTSKHETNGAFIDIVRLIKLPQLSSPCFQSLLKLSVENTNLLNGKIIHSEKLTVPNRKAN